MEADKDMPRELIADSLFGNLAKVLYEEMERLDPSESPPIWEALSVREQDYYMMLVRKIITYYNHSNNSPTATQ